MQPRTALFKVMVSHYYDGLGLQQEPIGELLVQLPWAGTPPTRDAAWLINTCGTIDGTNGFGAPITVPCVAFFNYYLDANQESGQASGQLPGQE